MLVHRLFLLVVFVGICGCGGTDLPDRAKVSGIVTLDGKPLPRGTITFMPDAQQSTTGPSASAPIGPDGRFQLTTNHAGRSEDGAVVGFHKVRIVAREDVEPGAPSRSLVPMRYANFNTSGLSAEVKADQTNQIDFPLSSR